jgi:hypothetical protein
VLHRPFRFEKGIVFPAALSPTLPEGSDQLNGIPCVIFNSVGQLVSEERNPGVGVYEDAVIPLVVGSLRLFRNAEGQVLPKVPEVYEAQLMTNNPAASGRSSLKFSSADPHYIKINWLTGKARLERREIDDPL